jgi:hypothetical protein
MRFLALAIAVCVACGPGGLPADYTVEGVPLVAGTYRVVVAADQATCDDGNIVSNFEALEVTVRIRQWGTDLTMHAKTGAGNFESEWARDLFYGGLEGAINEAGRVSLTASPRNHYHDVRFQTSGKTGSIRFSMGTMSTDRLYTPYASHITYHCIATREFMVYPD